MRLKNQLSAVLEGRVRGPGVFALVCLLTPFSWLYRIGLKLFLLPYVLRLRKKRRLPKPVISIGNLTFGGTGKTPAVHAICVALIESGLRPAILIRGHGGRVCGSMVIMGEASAEFVGDEAAMLAAVLPEVPVGVGKRRERSGQAILKQHDIDVFVLDDGMQYWQLHRDLDIVLVDADRPVGSGRVMPAGDLREPVGGLRRTQAVILVGNDDSGRAKQRLSKLTSAIIFPARRKPVSLIRIDTGEVFGTDWLRGRRICAMSGIGNPSSFCVMLKDLGAVVAENRGFPDHHRYTHAELASVEATAAAGCEAIITTAKDAVRLHEANSAIPILVLKIVLEIDGLERLIHMIRPETE